jgi:gliding motility-associated-like protein
LYKRDGTPVDAIYWTVAAGQQNKITSDEDFNDNPCTPAPVDGCNTTGVILRSATEIYNLNPALISYVGITAPNPVQPTGKTFSRIPDGGAWQSEVEPSIEGNNCNNGQCDVPTSGGGTCNGAATVSVTGGSGNYSYSWKDAQSNVVTTSSNASNLCPGEYCVTVTDIDRNCTQTACVTVEDKTQTITPEFDSYGPYCQGAILTQAILPENSNNGIKGTWSPASISTATAGDFEFTFTPDQGQCASVVKITVKITAAVTPEFDPIAPICAGSQAPSLPGSSKNGINGTWNPTSINNQEGGSYTFTPSDGQCSAPVTISVTVNPLPSVVVRTDTTVYHNATVPATNFLILPEGANVTWTNSQTSIGLAAAGTGNVQSFTAINTGQSDVTATITVIPTANNCQGTAQSYKITVRPLSRDVFVPNVFSPNGDGKNDQLKVFGNYIARLEMRIFNQYGEQVVYINNQSQGWDGTHRGKPQPVGVYVYVLKAVLTDGTEINKKGSITLIR